MDRRRLGHSSIELSPIGFGAFKIGRNEKTKYARAYDLPDDAQVETLLNGVLDLGINYIDTAPAYGISEQRIGKAIGHRSNEYIVSTKVGESFADGHSSYDFSADAIRTSVQQSLVRLKRDVLDIVFIHSDGRDKHILEQTDAVATLQQLRDRGDIRLIGFSGKTVEGAAASLAWTDALMVEYHLEDNTHEHVMRIAAEAGVGVVVKKGLASGRLSPDAAIDFVLSNQHVTSLVIGGLNLENIKRNVLSATKAISR